MEKEIQKLEKKLELAKARLQKAYKTQTYTISDEKRKDAAITAWDNRVEKLEQMIANLK